METAVLFFFVAVVEFVIAVLSTRMIAKGKLWTSVFLIFVEELTGFWVFYAFIESVSRGEMAIFYSLGASVGTGISIWLTRNMKEDRNEKRPES
jgi:hypothetical protein